MFFKFIKFYNFFYNLILLYLDLELRVEKEKNFRLISLVLLKKKFNQQQLIKKKSYENMFRRVKLKTLF